jgi:hypothetical protein
MKSDGFSCRSVKVLNRESCFVGSERPSDFRRVGPLLFSFFVIFFRGLFIFCAGLGDSIRGNAHLFFLQDELGREKIR